MQYLTLRISRKIEYDNRYSKRYICKYISISKEIRLKYKNFHEYDNFKRMYVYLTTLRTDNFCSDKVLFEVIGQCDIVRRININLSRIFLLIEYFIGIYI